MRAKQLKTMKAVLVFIFGVSFLLLLSHNAHAASWTDPVVSATTQLANDEMYQSTSASSMTISVKGAPLSYLASVTKGQHIWLARYTDPQTNVSYWAVKSSYDQQFVNLVGVPNDAINLVPGTDTLIWTQYIGNYNYGGLTTTRSAWQVLKLQFSSGKPFYVLDATKAKQWFKFVSSEGNATQRQALSYTRSPNGRYILAWYDYEYYLRLDLDTEAIQYVGRFRGAWYGGPSANPYAGAVTDDGRYAFIFGGPQVVDMTDCHVTLTEQQVITGVNPDNMLSCPVTQLSVAVSEKTGYSGYDSYYHWDDNGDSLVFFVNPYPYTSGPGGPTTKVTLRLTSETVSTLDYLALGDSYSSGEGDIEKDAKGTDHYLPLTDLGKDTCHISSRSYPFLLRDYWEIDSSSMKSVACSGAQVLQDYDRPLQGYFGQNNQLKGRSDLIEAQQIALNKFIPGRVPQLEFVKKYKPKIITLTGSGNDVGFAKILEYCANDVFEAAAFGYECEYVDGGILHQVLWDAIHTQYDTLTKLIQDIKQASPDSRIYLVGYPSFIGGSEANCAINNGSLSSNERDMINNAVMELNNIEQQAAQSAGVSFIDINDSLKGGRLCESNHTRYVTGVADSYLESGDPSDGAFHPNAEGHKKIAEAIEAQVGNNPYQVGEYDPVTSIFTQIINSFTYSYRLIEQQIVERGRSYELGADAYVFRADSSVSLSLHSDPIDLGQYHVDENGVLRANINIPSGVTPGRHLLLLKGVTPSGESITLYQFITVGSGKPGDLDGDGVPDESDTCEFIAHWYDENDLDVCTVPAKAKSSAVIEQQGGQTQRTIVTSSDPIGDQSNRKGNSDNLDKGTVPYITQAADSKRMSQSVGRSILIVALGLTFCIIIVIALRRMHGNPKKG